MLVALEGARITVSPPRDGAASAMLFGSSRASEDGAELGSGLGASATFASAGFPGSGSGFSWAAVGASFVAHPVASTAALLHKNIAARIDAPLCHLVSMLLLLDMYDPGIVPNPEGAKTVDLRFRFVG